MLKRLAVVLTTLLFAIPAFSAVLIDFESFTVGGYGAFPSNGNGGAATPSFDNPLAPLGISITGDANTRRLEVIAGEPGAPVTFGNNYIAINSLNDNELGNEGYSNTPATITIDFQRRGSTWFAQGSSITLDLWDTNSTPTPRVIVYAYDDLGNLVETVNFDANPNPSGTVTLAYTGLVSRIEVNDNGGDGHILDNLGFQLENTGVPEPASVIMIGSGLVAVGLLRRRRA